MPEELENTEDTPTPEENTTPGENLHANDAPTEDELADIQAQLGAEQASLAEAQAALTERDARIAELEAQLAQITTDREAFASQLYEANDAHGQAVARYLEVVRAVNREIPAEHIAGATIEEIDASVERGQAIADAVRANLAAENKNARVPAGAPTRAVNLEGLTPDELIRLGISQQGGND